MTTAETTETTRATLDPMLRRWLALGLFVAIAAASIDLSLLRFPFADRARKHEEMTQFPDRGGWSEYARFLDDVRRATPNGSSIAIVVPTAADGNADDYAYYRASYLLAGRVVLPTRVAGKPQRHDRTDYLAAWRVPVHRTSVRGRVILEEHGGALVAP